MRTFLSTSLLLCLLAATTHCSSSTAENKKAIASDDDYQCMPCGSDCDKKTFKEPGKCPECNMQLVKKSTVTFKTIQPGELCQYITDHPTTILLDVRTKEEFEGKTNPDYGTLKNAINIPIQVLEIQLGTLNAYKDKEIIVYCSHSHRSPRASYILTQNGFTNVINMAGGMSEMKDNSCKK